MRYKIEIRPLAAIEIIEAYDWYEEQREGLGAEFLEDLDRLYEVLSKNPYTFSYYDEPIRDGRLKRFPFTIAYEIFDTSTVIYSVFMVRQHPDKKRTK